MRFIRSILFPLAVLAFIAALQTIPSCKTTSVPGPSSPATTVLKDCGIPAVRDLATHLLDDVASAVAVNGPTEDAWKSALLTVAWRAGVDGLSAVVCAAQELLAQHQTQLAARGRMDAATAARTDATDARLKEWLAEVRR